jgi:hypothetical protein
MGGNAYDQKDKPESLISKEVGPAYALWPIAPGGWSNVNEVAYLERNLDVVHATNLFVWEYMFGGLHELSRWRGEYLFLSKHPLFASWYVFRRYVLPRFISLYPDKAQLSAAKHSLEWLPNRDGIEDICKRHGLTLIDVAQRPEWNESHYQGGTHPTEEGSVILAHILAAAISETLSRTNDR